MNDSEKSVLVKIINNVDVHTKHAFQENSFSTIFATDKNMFVVCIHSVVSLQLCFRLQKLDDLMRYTTSLEHRENPTNLCNVNVAVL